MPYAKIEDRREAWRRWARKHRQDKIVVLKKRSRDKAWWNIRESQPCSIKKCTKLGERHHSDYSKPLEIIWLCKRHHELVHIKEVRFCSREGCRRKYWAKDLCHVHYNKWKGY